MINLVINIYIKTTNITMICSKITRQLPNHNQQTQQQQIIIGISDYIPSFLRQNKTISISLIGNKLQIINHILWNQFFTKTLLKQAYYYLLQSSFKDNQNISAIFIKFNERVYKVEQVNEWKCPLRLQMLKSNAEPMCVQLQGFSNKGYIKKIIIFISKYNVNVDQMNIILNTASLQVIKQLNKNEVCCSSIQTQKILQENNPNLTKQYAISYNTLGRNDNFTKSSKKNTQESNVSFNTNTKRSVGNKQNSKNSSKLSKSKFRKTKDKQDSKNVSKLVKQSTSKSNLSKNFFSNHQFTERISKLNHQTVKTETNNPTRQSVMSKIITSKQEQIIHLKSQIQRKQRQFDQILQKQGIEHKTEIEELTGNVKQLLNTYENNQKEYINENIYLKDRVKVMEQTLLKNNQHMDKNTKDMENYLFKIRQQEQIISKLNQFIKSLKKSQQQTRLILSQQNVKLTNDVKIYREKAEQYKCKYDRMVDSMKSMLSQ